MLQSLVMAVAETVCIGVSKVLTVVVTYTLMCSELLLHFGLFGFIKLAVCYYGY